MIVVDVSEDETRGALQLARKIASERNVCSASMREVVEILSDVTGISADGDDLIEEVELPGNYAQEWATREEYEEMLPRLKLLSEHIPRTARMNLYKQEPRPDGVPSRTDLEKVTKTKLWRSRGFEYANGPTENYPSIREALDRDSNQAPPEDHNGATHSFLLA